MKIKLPFIDVFGISDIGLLRENNEDVWAELLENHFYVLADGMGGHLAGEVAAKEAVLHFCDAIDKYFRTLATPSLPSAKKYISDTFISANSWIRRLSKDHPDLNGMGTTLCCLLVLQDKVLISHVGDSRVYRFRNALSLLTTDHSLAQQSFIKSKKHPFPCKHILTKALGISTSIEPDLLETDYIAQDIYMLCSDGLHDALSDLEIEAILKQPIPIKEMAIQLIESAKAAKGSDNITVILIQIGYQ